MAAKKSSAKNGSKVFTKTDLVEKLAKEHDDLTKTKVSALVNDVFDELKTGIKRNDRVSIGGFGSYTSKTLRKTKGGKKMYMPALGKEVVTKPKPTRLQVNFRPAKDLRIK